MNRRFLYMVVWNWETPFTQTLHRINPSRLFYPNGHSPAAPAAVENARKLPRPASAFCSHRPMDMSRCYAEMPLRHFMLLGKDKILAVGGDGHAALYDDAARCSHTLPPARSRHRIEPLSVAVGDDSLYVLGANPRDEDGGGGDDEEFAEALVREDPKEGWRYSWRVVPPPPPYAEKEQDVPTPAACAEVGGSSLWVSAEGHGTYALDTASGGGGAWSKVGDWELPFEGSAEYAPVLGLWFGFSASSHPDSDDGDPRRLCAWDLLRAGDGDGRGAAPPVASHAWRSFGVPEPAAPRSRTPSPCESRFAHGERVAHLGRGRFCVARFVDVGPRTPRRCRCSCYAGCLYQGPSRRFAVLTGVEVQQHEDGCGGLRLVEHKTCRYSLGFENERGAQFVI